jgi:hypothetical protein
MKARILLALLASLVGSSARASDCSPDACAEPCATVGLKFLACEVAGCVCGGDRPSGYVVVHVGQPKPKAKAHAPKKAP